ncbi:aminoacyl-tRNA hydrolase [Candidatus Peregrinibacteria bacterium]|jgi:peptidyl-tRNA hydrolase, PTH1 family|nr:aminoacyl-tRNA hydrolase [Candidatus Peregrinibacteria bacterium]
MKVLVGLGNPGKEYEKTRHNIGFMALDAFLRQNDFPAFKKERKFKAEISEGIFKGEKVLLLKPQTFMNLSGESLSLIKSFYKLEVEDFVVIYDDKDMEFGKIRVRKEGSAGGHNGVKSIISYLGSSFLRIKVGLADKNHPAFNDTSAFVLSRFSDEELKVLDEELIPGVLEEVEGG